MFFLDMGAPIRIQDLAENLIRLSGLEPHREVPIRVTGLRPGERLQEELVVAEEDLVPTEHEKVWVARHRVFDRDGFWADLEALRGLVAARDQEGAVAQLRAMAERY